MFAYWLMFSIFAVGSIGKLRQSATVPRYAPLFAVALFLLVVLIGFRFEVGGDWLSYGIMYADMHEESWTSVLAQNDPGYMILNRVSGAVGGGIVLVNLICAIIFCWGLSKLANLQPDPWLAILVAIPYLVIVVAMGYTRQSVAIGLMMGSIAAFQKQRYVSFFLCLAIAAMFHKTVIVTVPLIALSTVRHRFVVWATAGALGAFIFLFFISALLDAMVDTYVTQGMASDGAGIRVAMTALPALIYLLAPGRLVINEGERLLWRNFAIVSVLTIPGMILVSSSTLIDRVSLYLIPLQMVVLSRLPMAFPREGKPNGIILVGVMLYSAAIQFIWLNFSSHADFWVPYSFYLGEN